MDGSTSGSWSKSTIDNDATTSQIIILARVYKATNNSKYLNSCLKGIDLLLNNQYPNGGWPQIFNDPGTYHAHITYNDGAMIHVMQIIKDISENPDTLPSLTQLDRQKLKLLMKRESNVF